MTFTVDARSPDPAQRDLLLARHEALMHEVAERRGLGLTIRVDSDRVPVASDPELVEAIAAAVNDAGIPAQRMTSGAVHDAMQLAEIARVAEAMRRVCRRLEGAFTLVAIDRTQPDLVVGARRNSPLVVGLGEGENFLASDVAAFVDHTRNALELGQDQVVILTPDEVFVTGTAAEVAPVTKVDGRVIGTGKPGPITKELMAAFKELAMTTGTAIFE